MKLTSVEMHPEGSSDFAVLSFRDPRRSNPYNVKSIVGLDADEIVRRYYGASGSAKFYNLSQEKRDVIVKMGLNPRYGELETYSDLRDSIYKMVASSRTGKLHLYFMNGEELVAALNGFVTKIESPHFEKTQEIQLTISCEDPMLRAMYPTEIDIAELDPASTIIQDIQSTAPHGFRFALDINANIASLILADPDDEDWSFEVVPAGGFLNNDILYFSSEFNNKYLYLERGANIFYLADVITPGSIWPILFPGDNEFALTNPTQVAWNAISYYSTYWGV